jgi:hypothetical protein
MKSGTLNQSLSREFSTKLAFVSFSIGTILLGLQKLLPMNMDIIFLGFLYVLFAILINGIMLFNLAYHFIILPKQREYIAIKILILLANIPITFLYILIVFNINILNL